MIGPARHDRPHPQEVVVSRPVYRVSVTPADVGRRVTLRARTGAPDGEPQHTDTVGRLLDWADDVLSVERRDGSVTRVRVADLAAGRVIPERPPH